MEPACLRSELVSGTHCAFLFLVYLYPTDKAHSTLSANCLFFCNNLNHSPSSPSLTAQTRWSPKENFPTQSLAASPATLIFCVPACIAIKQAVAIQFPCSLIQLPVRCAPVPSISNLCAFIRFCPALATLPARAMSSWVGEAFPHFDFFPFYRQFSRSRHSSFAGQYPRADPVRFPLFHRAAFLRRPLPLAVHATGTGHS